MNNLIARLKAANADIERGDESLWEELKAHRESASFTPESAGQADLVIEGQTIDREDFVQETIVLRAGRPVLAVVRSKARLMFDEPESLIWKARLQKAESHLVRAAQSVGRIEVEGHHLAWLGTGWLVAPDVIVTNRHVASEFGRQRGSRYVFRHGLDDRDMTASIDFIEEIDSRDSLVFRLEEIMHIEDEDGPDLAFLRVTPVAGQVLAPPIELAVKAAEADEMVAVIGYSAREGRIPDQELVDKIFGQVYDKKRLAPGQIKRVGPDAIHHDCSTLGGNSGSVVLSLQTGHAVGLHFAGRFLAANFAVPSTVVGERLDDVRRGVFRKRPAAPATDRPESAAQQTVSVRLSGSSASYVFPIRVTIDVGEPYARS